MRERPLEKGPFPPSFWALLDLRVFMKRASLCAAVLAALAAGAQETAEVKPLGPRLEAYAYPYPTQEFAVHSQGQDLAMVYMDLKPARPDGRAAVLLHGKNFCGPYWIATAERLRDQGYRVVGPDPVGFCESAN